MRNPLQTLLRPSLPLIAILFALLLLPAGCGGGSSLDTSSPEAFKKSVETVTKSLGEAKGEKFEQAVQAIMVKHVVLAQGVTDEAAMTKKIKELFDGKSVDQIIEMGEKQKAETKKEIDQMMKQ